MRWRRDVNETESGSKEANAGKHPGIARPPSMLLPPSSFLLCLIIFHQLSQSTISCY